MAKSNKWRILDNLVRFAKSYNFDYETVHYRMMWDSMAENSSLSQIIRYAKTPIIADMPPDQQALIMMSQMVISELVSRRMAGEIDQQGMKSKIDGAPSLSDLEAMYSNQDEYEKPE